MPRDIHKAIQHLRANAGIDSQERCAAHTREAIEAARIRLALTRHAKDYGPSLNGIGFHEVSSVGPFQAGDVAVIQPVKGSMDGHMCMFDGSIWISDFKQFRGLYPGPRYRNEKPSYKIYRHP